MDPRHFRQPLALPRDTGPTSVVVDECTSHLDPGRPLCSAGSHVCSCGTHRGWEVG